MYKYTATAGTNNNETTAVKSARGEYSYMDVKEASEYTERFRAESMMLIWKLKDRRKRAKTNPILSMLQRKEMTFLEEQTTQAVRLYKESKNLYHTLYNAYLEQLMTPHTYVYKNVA